MGEQRILEAIQAIETDLFYFNGAAVGRVRHKLDGIRREVTHLIVQRELRDAVVRRELKNTPWGDELTQAAGRGRWK